MASDFYRDWRGRTAAKTIFIYLVCQFSSKKNLRNKPETELLTVQIPIDLGVIHCIFIEHVNPVEVSTLKLLGFKPGDFGPPSA